jgi:UDP-2-acetamido-3-amino-2,3-dideoxy-glucuronate N-acetyltransferase
VVHKLTDNEDVIPAPSYVSPLAIVDETCSLAAGVKVWHFSQVREGAVLGENCVVSKDVYIGPGVKVGANTKIQNAVQIHDPAEIQNGVFLGPNVIITNDKVPRAVSRNGSALSSSEWHKVGTTVKEGASIGAGSTIVSPCVVGSWSLVGAGSVVTHDVPDHAMVYGNPAKFVNWVGYSGEILESSGEFWISPISGDRFQKSEGGLVIEES